MIYIHGVNRTFTSENPTNIINRTQYIYKQNPDKMSLQHAKEFKLKKKSHF